MSTTSAPVQPTYSTPRSPHRYSDGRFVGAVIAGKLNRRPTAWQQHVLDVGLERVDGPGSPFAYPNVDLIVGRRCGKSVTTMGVPLARAIDGPVTLDNGRVLPFFGAHTAQNLVKARQRFMRDLVEPYRDSMSPALWQTAIKLRESIGDTGLLIDSSLRDWRVRDASSISVFAPTRSSVRGDGLMHLTFDEYLVLTAVAGKDLMSAAGPTLGDARGHGQIWRCSNVSVLNNDLTALWDMKERGRRIVDSGATTGTAYFEFTVPDDFDLNDEESWARYYPAINDGIIRLEELREDRIRLGDDSFAAEYFGLWPGDSQMLPLWSTISRDAWTDAGARADSFELPTVGLAALGVDVDPFDRSTAITACTSDGDVLMQEVIDERPGSAWVAARLRDLAGEVDAIGVDDYGPGHDLLAQLVTDDAVKEKLVPVKSQDFVSACFAWDARLRDRRLKIRQSDHYEKLTAAAGAAQRTVGKAWQWERRLPTPQATVVSATLAAWALGRAPTPPQFFVY